MINSLDELDVNIRSFCSSSLLFMLLVAFHFFFVRVIEYFCLVSFLYYGCVDAYSLCIVVFDGSELKWQCQEAPFT